MFCCWCLDTSKKLLSLSNHYEVIDLDLVDAICQRLVAGHGKYVRLYRCLSPVDDKRIPYFMVIFHRETNYSFVIYHHELMSPAHEHYLLYSPLFCNLAKAISKNKSTAEEQIKNIIQCVKFNPTFTSTHVAAQIGLSSHFTENKQIVLREMNIQTPVEMFTPLHLAIIHNRLEIVEALLNLKPNLDLVDSRQFSVLHCSALMTHQIFCKVLYQEGMFDRILWKNKQGVTALHLACFSQNFANVFEFLRFGLTVEMLTLSSPRAHKNSKTSNISAQGSSDQSIRSKIAKKPRLIKFTEEDLADIDCQDIVMGGSPLHWARHRRLLDKLIPYKFNLNTGNINGDTALHLMVRRNRIQCVICLLCAGAEVNVKNHFGNTPLHLAIKNDDKVLTQTLIVFDADIDAINNVGESARHLASRDTSASMLLYLLSSIGAKRCDSQMEGCPPGCSFYGNFEGRCDPALLELTNHFQNFFADQQKAKRFGMEMKKPVNENENGVNMLTFDGGGIKGVIVVQMMIEIQKFLDGPIIDYFDWLAGTSTGSFIAAWLATGKQLTEIRKIYFNLKDGIFVGERPYNSDTLEEYTRETIGADIKMEDLLIKNKKYVMIPAALYDRVPLTLHLFRSYESANELLKKPNKDSRFPPQPSREQYVWKACRASGAAPTYFRAFGPFIDGGLLCNNPTLDALTDFQFRKNALITLNRKSEVQKLNLVLSLGTGRELPEPKEPIDISAISFNFMEINNQIRYFYHMTTMLLFEICNTDNHLVDRAEAFCSGSNILFFRINPLFDQLISLDESQDSKIVNILWETKRYMYHQRSDVIRIAEYLKKTKRIKSSKSNTSKKQLKTQLKN